MNIKQQMPRNKVLVPGRKKGVCLETVSQDLNIVFIFF